MSSRSQMHWLTETGMFFERKGPVWDALRALTNRCAEAGIDYVVIGGLALNAYNYPRQTEDIDVVVTAEGYASLLHRFAGDYDRVEGAPRRIRDRTSEVTVDFLIAGELAGHRGRNRRIRFPDPGKAENRDDLRTVPLGRLIELKLVTWRYKDWGDVVELIRRNNLGSGFADELDPSVRGAYGQCYDQATDTEYGER